MSIRIDFELISSKGARVEFKQDLIKYLVQQYHNDANKARISYKCRKPKAQIDVVGDYTIIQGKMAIDRWVTKIIQLANAKKAEIDYIVSQYQEEWKYIDSEARNYFNTGLSVGRMKCFAKFNHYAWRNKAINNKVKDRKCSQCQENEE